MQCGPPLQHYSQCSIGPVEHWDSPHKGGILDRLAELDGSRELVIWKALLTRHTWHESARGGGDVLDSGSSWIDGGSPPINGSEQLELDYDITRTQRNL